MVYSLNKGKPFWQGSVVDEYGNSQNDQILITAESGHGKTSLSESIIEEYFNSGYTVIHMADVKNEFESAFSMFEPIPNSYHSRKLLSCNKPSRAIPTKIYHPFSFNIPRKQMLPDINFFSFALNELTSEEFAYILEETSDSENVTLLTNLVSDLGNDSSIYDLLHLLQRSINPSKDMSKGFPVRKPSRKVFWLKSGMMGSRKNITAISTKFLPFLRHYYLQPKNSPINLDVKSILKDNKHYHVLVDKWIQEKKMKYFNRYIFFNKIERNIDFAKHPIIFVWEEIRNIIPAKTNEGYVEKMAQNLREKISTIRNKGKGCSSIGTSQVYRDIHPAYRDSVTERIFGRLSPSDINLLNQSIGLDRDLKTQLSSMKTGEFWRLGDDNETCYGALFPGHRHKDEMNYNFFKFYKKQFPDKLRGYEGLVLSMKESLKNIDRKYREMAINQYRHDAKMLSKVAEDKSVVKEKSVEVSEVLGGIKKFVRSSTDDRVRLALALKTEREMNPKITLFELGEKYSISHTKVAYLLKVGEEIEKRKLELEKNSQV